jgi:dienelactone hydrolase
VETVEYAPGRLVDRFGDPSQPTVLMWHGQQSNARAALRPLAELVADHGLAVVVPDWDSHGDDGGRGDLLASVQYVKEHLKPSNGVVLVGWSLGGLAAAGLTVHAREYGIELLHTVCLAGAFVAADPISGEHLEKALAREPSKSPFTLLHGMADEVLPVEVSRSFAAVLERNGWPVDVVELAAGHGSIAGATYDSGADRYAPATDAETLAVAADVGSRIAGAAHR